MGIARDRTVEQQLVESQFTLEDIAFAESGLVFDIERCSHFLVNDQIAKIGTVPCDFRNHGFGKGLAIFVVPLAVREMVWRILHKHRCIVFARRGHCRVNLGRDKEVDIGALGPATFLPVIIGALDFQHVVQKMQIASETARIPGDAAEARHPIERDVELAR